MSEPLISTLGARVHLFVQPSRREAFRRLFADVLGCDVIERDFGLDYPILLVTLSAGSFSVEFTDAAPDAEPPIDDASAFRGAWLEFRSNDVAAAQAALRAENVPTFRHRGSNHDYYVAPGGQVFRVLSLDYVGP